MTTQWALLLLFTTMETYYAAVILNEVKVKYSAIPVRALSAARIWGSQDFCSVEKWKWQVCQPCLLATFSCHFSYRLSRPQHLRWPEDSSRLKMSMIPSGIEPATSLLAAQCLNQMRHRLRIIVAHKVSGSPSYCSTHRSPRADLLMVVGSWV
jgi:hypothetical protein